jgi:hypothetical protein
MKNKDHKMLQEAYSKVNEDREWHEMGAETDPVPDMGDVLKGAKSMKPEDTDYPDTQQQDLIDFVEKYRLNYDDLAKEIAKLLKNEYGSHNFIPFMSVLYRDLSQSKE